MGYRIEYGPVKKVRGIEKRISRRSALFGCFFFIFLLMLFIFWPEGADAVCRILLPGDSDIAVSAFTDLTEDIQSGERIFLSLHNFCQKILDGANLDFH